MTVITAAHYKGEYAMACDSLHIMGYTKIHTVDENSKVIQIGGNLIGFAGSVINRQATACVLREILSKHVLSCVEGIYILMLDVHKKLKEEHFLTAQANYENPFEDNNSNILICNEHGIFRVDGERSVLKHEGHWAIGSGMHYALGAMHSYVNNPDSATHLDGIVERGVKAACEYSDSCQEPVQLWEGP